MYFYFEVKGTPKLLDIAEDVFRTNRSKALYFRVKDERNLRIF